MATNRDMRSTISVQGYTNYRLHNCTLTNVKKRAETARERKVSSKITNNIITLGAHNYNSFHD